MSYLRKYAKPRAATKKKQYGTRLTEDEGKEFEAYCEELNLKPAEAIRYLILEELDRKQKQTITGDNKRDQLLSPVNTEKTNDIDLSTNAINKIPVDNKMITNVNKPQMGKRKYLNQFKVGDHLPCPVCKKWVDTDHFSNRHAKVHSGLPSHEFLRVYEKEALAMVRQKKNELNHPSERI